MAAGTIAAPGGGGSSPAAAAAKAGGVGFNKMFVMVPVMLAARKLDAEDPKIVYYLRVAYGSMQTICVLVVLYTYMKASSNINGSKIVYVPAAATPFAAPDAKKKYTQVDYKAHVLSTARSLLGSTLFGVAMTVGLHIYKGMAMGLAIQTIMGPLNLFENPLVKALLLGNGFCLEDKIFDEKTMDELADEDEVVDESGNDVPKSALAIAGKVEETKKKQSPQDAFDELLLDTWDMGNKADIPSFMKNISKKNCNNRTKENGWTPLMVLSGLDADGTVIAIKKIIEELGGNPGITDAEGWNALHWSAFHGSVKAAKELYEQDKSLLGTKDNDGKLPVEMAHNEDNKDVAIFLEECTASSETAADVTGGEEDKEGMRKRK